MYTCTPCPPINLIIGKNEQERSIREVGGERGEREREGERGRGEKGKRGERKRRRERGRTR